MKLKSPLEALDQFYARCALLLDEGLGPVLGLCVILVIILAFWCQG